MDNRTHEQAQDTVEDLESTDGSGSLEELDIPDDLKRELLRELDGLKEGREAPPRA